MENYLSQITNYLLMQSWQIAILVVVIAAVNMALKNRSAHVRYLLWLIVLAKCLVPPLVTIPLAVFPQDKMPEPTVISNGEMPAVNVEMADTVTSELIVLPSLPVTSPTIMERLARVTARQWMGFGWIVGVAALLFFAVIKALRTEFWLKCERKPLPAELQMGIENLFSELNLKTFPKIWLVEGIGQPFVWGLLRGSIYLPADFVKVNSTEHRKGVLGHELSHVLHYDAAVNVLQILAQAVFWFHPFVWWANKKIRGEREKCCDEMAIAQLGAKAKDYSNAIVNTLINEYESTRPVPSLAIAGPVKNIEERIKTIMKPGKNFYERPSLMAVTVVLLLALLVVPTVLVLTARAGTKAGGEAGRVAEGTLVRDADKSELSESNNKVTCTGKVVDTQGRPIAGAKVTAYESNFNMAGSILLHQVGEVKTAENGAFVFVTKPKPERGAFDDCYIVATKQDLALGWIVWNMRENIESNVQLGEPEKLEGVIVDEAGKPVVGAEVRANLYRTIETTEGEEKREWLPGIAPLQELGTTTDSQGEFIFSNLPGDLGVDLLVTAAGKATTYTYRSALREPAFKTRQPPIRVVLPEEARIEGKILDPDTGRGIARTEFTVVASFSGLFYYRFVYTTDDDGRFNIGGLQTGRYGLLKGRFPRTHVDVKSGETTKITVRARAGANAANYFHILLERGSPAVLKPERKIIVRFEENEGVRNVGHIDVDGYLKVYLSQREYRQWQRGKAWFTALIPDVAGKSFRREEIFSYADLIKDWPKTIKAKEARPKDESGLLIGKSLTGMKDFGVDLLSDEINDKMILVCFFDMQQRPSRYFLRELARQTQQLKQKGVTVVAIQASKIDKNALNKWVKNDDIPFAVGMVRGDAEKNKIAWGVQALPWLILTDRNRVISAEGFGLSELYEKIETVAEK